MCVSKALTVRNVAGEVCAAYHFYIECVVGQHGSMGSMLIRVVIRGTMIAGL